jgi:HEAT repeat protein
MLYCSAAKLRRSYPVVQLHCAESKLGFSSSFFSVQGYYPLSQSARERESSVQQDALTRSVEVQGFGGSTDREIVSTLMAYLTDDDPLVRWEAALALAKTAQSLESAQGLERVLRSEQAPLTSDELLAWIRRDLGQSEALQREAIADALGHWPQQAAVQLLSEAMHDEAPRVRASAARSLGRLGAMETTDSLLAMLDDPSVWVRIAAADALGAIGDTRAVGPLSSMTARGPMLTRVAAISALGQLPSREARQRLIKCLSDEDGEVRWHSARALEQIGTVAALPGLERLLGDDYTLFDQPIHRIAQSTIRAIRQREQGAWHAIRHAVFRLWGWLRRQHAARQP